MSGFEPPTVSLGGKCSVQLSYMELEGEHPIRDAPPRLLRSARYPEGESSPVLYLTFDEYPGRRFQLHVHYHVQRAIKAPAGFEPALYGFAVRYLAIRSRRQGYFLCTGSGGAGSRTPVYGGSSRQHVSSLGDSFLCLHQRTHFYGAGTVLHFGTSLRASGAACAVRRLEY